jgi:hypothetical protein
MRRFPLKLPALILGAYIVLHVSLELHVIHRGIMVPTGWEMLEWALTFPLSIWQFFFGLPATALARLLYYVLVIANTLFLGLMITKLRRNAPKQHGAEQGVAPQSATRSDSDSVGDHNPQPDSEARSR